MRGVCNHTARINRIHTVTSLNTRRTTTVHKSSALVPLTACGERSTHADVYGASCRAMCYTGGFCKEQRGFFQSDNSTALSKASADAAHFG